MNFSGFRGMDRARSPVLRCGSGTYVKTVPTTTTIIPPPRYVEPTYTMAMLDGENAEITMYGEIVDARPMNWWTGEPVEGAFIIQAEFLKDLEAIAGAKVLTIRMDSVGGDAGVSILIHNRLRDLAAKGTKLKCIVDGVAMSGGSLIMSACDVHLPAQMRLVRYSHIKYDGKDHLHDRRRGGRERLCQQDSGGRRAAGHRRQRGWTKPVRPRPPVPPDAGDVCPGQSPYVHTWSSCSG